MLLPTITSMSDLIWMPRMPPPGQHAHAATFHIARPDIPVTLQGGQVARIRPTHLGTHTLLLYLHLSLHYNILKTFHCIIGNAKKGKLVLVETNLKLTSPFRVANGYNKTNN
jgi:hypothetical protein